MKDSAPCPRTLASSGRRSILTVYFLYARVSRHLIVPDKTLCHFCHLSVIERSRETRLEKDGDLYQPLVLLISHLKVSFSDVSKNASDGVCQCRCLIDRTQRGISTRRLFSVVYARRSLTIETRPVLAKQPRMQIQPSPRTKKINLRRRGLNPERNELV